jgi:Plavaka transposase
MLSSDLLHQVIKGTFKDHLVTWVEDYLKAHHSKAEAESIMDQIDRRCVHIPFVMHTNLILPSLAAAPAFSGLRNFKDGRRFKQWTGDDSKALMKVSGITYLLSTELCSRIYRSISQQSMACYLLTSSNVSQRFWISATLFAGMTSTRIP